MTLRRKVTTKPMRLIRILQCLIFAASATLVTQVLTGIADSAPAPNTCVSTSEMPRTYTHGSPLTGLTPPSDYYYLSVTPGPNCAVNPGDTVHLVATIRIDEILPAVGAPGLPPDPSRVQQWWILFHLGSGDTGDGFGLGNDPTHVTMTGGQPTPCSPAPKFQPEICVITTGASTITMNYDGPDVFGLAQGGAAGFRIGNAATDGAIVTDYATETLVAGNTTATTTTSPDSTTTTTGPVVTTTPTTVPDPNPSTLPDTARTDPQTTPRGCDPQPVK